MSVEPTIPMDEFLVKYRKDDNEWWRLESGDMQNLFEEAVDRAEAAEAEVERLRELIERVMTQHWDMAACMCWFCVKGRWAGCHPRSTFATHDPDYANLRFSDDAAYDAWRERDAAAALASEEERE